ncbi:ABC transporter permease [Holdemania massiliensis]|uniref:ABC transporter permease n=1 Tax=Holdemania massiliensis TaxID=1468449 RepID=UPI001F057681|nr:ABC transporter permease [Holdemania massiliensis]MCH1941296.1 ABC transporter permease [Holdemania massiliensis]
MLKLSTLKQSMKMSFQNILGNKMRSFLTMLGIIIGVTAVISLITIVSSVTGYMMDSFSSMGAGSLTVSANGTALKQGLSENDLAEIQALNNVAGISPTVSVSTQVVQGTTVSDEVTVSGKNEKYFIRNDIVTLGRPLTAVDMENNITVCLIDQDCAETFFLGENPIGQTLKIGGVQYQVIGLCSKDDSLMSSLGGSGGDGTIYIPYKNALALNGRNSVTSLEVYVSDTTRTDALVNDLETLLDNTFNHADNAYSVMNMDSLLDMMNTMQTMMTSLLAGIASIALLVGGIGIMNMMLVSVTERTKEIGLRKALGAEPGIIQLQFLMESIILSVMGGLIGIVLGEAISYGAAVLLGTVFAINLSAIGLGFGFSLAVGVIFGWAPARNASRLNPIDALRSE